MVVSDQEVMKMSILGLVMIVAFVWLLKFAYNVGKANQALSERQSGKVPEYAREYKRQVAPTNQDIVRCVRDDFPWWANLIGIVFGLLIIAVAAVTCR